MNENVARFYASEIAMALHYLHDTMQVVELRICALTCQVMSYTHSYHHPTPHHTTPHHTIPHDNTIMRCLLCYTPCYMLCCAVLSTDRVPGPQTREHPHRLLRARQAV